MIQTIKDVFIAITLILAITGMLIGIVSTKALHDNAEPSNRNTLEDSGIMFTGMPKNSAQRESVTPLVGWGH